MRFKKVIISVLVAFIIISVNSQCYAKYVFEYTMKAVEIEITNN